MINNYQPLIQTEILHLLLGPLPQYHPHHCKKSPTPKSLSPDEKPQSPVSLIENKLETASGKSQKVLMDKPTKICKTQGFREAPA